jgi:hypothetical protein
MQYLFCPVVFLYPNAYALYEKHHPEMLFETWEDARMYYNRYAKHVGFSIKSSTSRNYFWNTIMKI